MIAKIKKQQELIIKDHEVERLLLSLAKTRGEFGFDEEEGVRIVRWAERARIGSTMLDMVLDGTCDVDWIADEVAIKLADKVVYRELSDADAV